MIIIIMAKTNWQVILVISLKKKLDGNLLIQYLC